MPLQTLLGLALFTLSLTAQAQPPARGPIIVRERTGRTVESLNWAGYAVTGPPGSVTNAKGSWVVPAIQGRCGLSNSYSAFWVGFDGYSSRTVEQIGTSSDCIGGAPTYYAWFEFFPRPPIRIMVLPISPGDIIVAEVHFDGGDRFTVAIQDTTTGLAYRMTQTVPNAARSSAEWIAEAPYSNGVLPLADFGVLNSGLSHTAQNETCFATLGGTTAPLGLFPGGLEITMAGKTGATKAFPSPLSPDGSSFSATWVSFGP